MNFDRLQDALKDAPPSVTRFVLPDGSYIPAHAHVTEVGYVSKKFVDCGGVNGHIEAVLLQTHVGSDTHHRLRSDRLAKILDFGNPLLPRKDLPVEIEYDCCVVAQYPVAQVKSSGGEVEIVLGQKRTQCLAKE